MSATASEPFYAHAAEGRLTCQRCDRCHALRWPPLPGCPECRSRDASWVDLEPSGTIWSYVVYHRAFQPALRDDIPYTVAMVQLDAGPYMVNRLIENGDPPRIGARVLAEIRTVDDVPNVQWRMV